MKNKTLQLIGFITIALLLSISCVSCSSILELITGVSKCAYPNCTEQATENSAYCTYHKPPRL